MSVYLFISLGKSKMLGNLWNLAVIFFQIGSFSIGGGYAIITLIEALLVEQYQWITLKEYTDIITISQMTPGPLAINASSFVGLKLGGFWGAVVATFSCVITGVVISLMSYRFFSKHRDSERVMYVLNGLKAIATGLIGGAGAGILLLALTNHNQFSLHIEKFDFYALSVVCVAFTLLRCCKTSPVLLLLLSAVGGIFVY